MINASFKRKAVYILTPNLLRFCSTGGCAAKVGPLELNAILFEALPELRGWEDVGIVHAPSTTLLQTLDVIAPVSDVPERFGAISAAHALADIYAKAGTPISALMLMAFPVSMIELATVRATISGALTVLKSEGVPLVGGHTLNSPEVFCGFAVTGCQKMSFLPNRGAAVGNALVLTKSLGTGVLVTAQKMQDSGEAVMIEPDWVDISERVMMTTNSQASALLSGYSVHACTDVSGFGLIGHALEMFSEGVVRIEHSKIPVLPGVEQLIRAGITSVGGDRNWAAWADHCEFESEDAHASLPILFDPQTSGGLLISLPMVEAIDLTSQLVAVGVAASIIGEVIEGTGQPKIIIC